MVAVVLLMVVMAGVGKAVGRKSWRSAGRHVRLALPLALALGTAVALTNPKVRQGIRAAQSTLSSNTIRAPGLEVASNASLRDRYQAAWAREQARQRQ